MVIQAEEGRATHAKLLGWEDTPLVLGSEIWPVLLEHRVRGREVGWGG